MLIQREPQMYSLKNNRLLAQCKLVQPVAFDNPRQDIEQARAFTAALGGGVFNFRCIHDRNRGVQGVNFRGTIDEVWPQLITYNQLGYGCFVVVNECDGAGQSKGNITNIRAQFVDLDNLSAMQNLARADQWSIKPSFMVQSSANKAHVYWPVARFQGNERFETVQQKLIQLYDGDRQCADAPRVMRLPGSFHQKGEPQLVTCSALSGYGQVNQVEALELALAHVNVVDHSGERAELGNPNKAAPSLEWVQYALDNCDPNELNRSEWISFTAAIKQSGWSLTDPDTLYIMWSAWCARYTLNDVAENLKQWNSLTETQQGWKSVQYRVPAVKVALTFGGVTQQQPVAGQAVVALGATQAVKNHLDEPIFGSLVDKPITTELYKIMRDQSLAIGFNVVKQRIEKTGMQPWSSETLEWTDIDYLYLESWFHQFDMKPTLETVKNVTALFADQHKFDPLLDYLRTLKWDGVKRLDGMLANYFKAENIEFANLISAKFMIGTVARVFEPGCKRDEVLVLEGRQDLGKSTSVEILAGADYFSDGLPNMKDKEAYQHLTGLWICEIAELAASRKADREQAKNFITKRTDKFRPPYGRSVIEQKRTCVFVATTNDDVYLNDPTGARRWWPIKCQSHIDLDGLRRDRDQLFAEAVVRYQSKEAWWLSTIEAKAIAARNASERQEVDPWEQRIAQHCNSYGLLPITLENIFLNVLGIDFVHQHAGNNKRVKDILTKLGFKQQRKQDGRFYVKS
jgi:predicted P-loop ATPase